jgi:hypothetical protein
MTHADRIDVRRVSASFAAALAATVSVAAAAGCAGTAKVTLARPESRLTIRRPALYPETIEYDEKTGRFLVGSMRDGGVFEVERDGAVSRLVTDERLCSVLGIVVDAKRGRLWAVNADVGSSLRPSPAGPKKLAAVGIYDLATGAAVDYVDVAPVFAGAHLLNGIALDRDGNAYVTDSFSPVIYKIDAQGKPSVFLESPQFAGEGINLNGLVVHPDGYLLVVKKSDGALFKVPLADPSRFTKVAIADALIGGDGVLLVGTRDLVIIANQVPGSAANAAFSLSTDDDWTSARRRAAQPIGDVYPTTGIVQGGKIYVLSSKLNELLQAPPEAKGRLRMEATIQEIGSVSH